MAVDLIAAERLRRLSPGRLPLPRLRRSAVLALLAVVLLLGGGWLWLRDSSLVSVRHIRIRVEGGPDAGQIRHALSSAARNMTTLDVRLDQLRAAVAPYPVVKDLQVSTDFPHGIRIHVVEQIPVAAVSAGGRAVAVAGDGTLLHDVAASSLPTIPLRVPPGGQRVTEPDALHAVAVLAAAPYAMLGRITQVTQSGGQTVAQLRGGPSILFGDGSQLGAKWAAATAVLGDAGSAGASYIDVSDPARPAAGTSAGQSGVAAIAGTAATAAAATAGSVAAGAGASATARPGG